MKRFLAIAPALFVAGALPILAQSPKITQQGDPSIKPDTIYNLAVNPADVPGETATLLLDDGVVRLEANGTGTKTYHQIVQILRPEGAERYREQRFSYAPKHEKFTLNWVRVVKPDGSVISEKPAQVQESDVPAQMGDPTYSDRKVIRASLTGVEPGTIVDYSYTTEELKPFLPGDFFESWSVSTGLAVKRSRYIVDVPASLKIRIHEENLNFARRDTVIGARRVITWATRNLPKIKPEQFAADSNGVFMSLVVSSPTTWADIGKWYAANAKSRYTLTPAAESKLASVLKGARSFDDTLRAVHRWVAQDVRYVAIALGMGGYQPRTPDEVVSSGFGDCKDKATLFVAALNKVGVTAFPVILNSSGGVRRELPAIEQFDHAIAAYKHPGSTRYDFADLTAEFTPLGELPFDEQGSFALVVHPDGVTEEVTLPKTPIAANHTETRVTGTIAEDGTFDGVFEERAVGAPQGMLRELFANPIDSAARAQAANAIAGKWFEGAEGDALTGFLGKDLAATPKMSVRIHHGKAASLAGNTVILKNPFASMGAMGTSAKQLDAEPARLFPIDPEKIFGYSDNLSEFTVTLPEGWKAQLPSTVDATGPFGMYHAEYTQTGRELRISRRVTGASGVQPPTARSALTAWMRQIAKDDASVIVILKSSF